MVKEKILVEGIVLEPYHRLAEETINKIIEMEKERSINDRIPITTEHAKLLLSMLTSVVCQRMLRSATIRINSVTSMSIKKSLDLDDECGRP